MEINTKKILCSICVAMMFILTSCSGVNTTITTENPVTTQNDNDLNYVSIEAAKKENNDSEVIVKGKIIVKDNEGYLLFDDTDYIYVKASTTYYQGKYIGIKGILIKTDSITEIHNVTEEVFIKNVAYREPSAINFESTDYELYRGECGIYVESRGYLYDMIFSVGDMDVIISDDGKDYSFYQDEEVIIRGYLISDCKLIITSIRKSSENLNNCFVKDDNYSYVSVSYTLNSGSYYNLELELSEGFWQTTIPLSTESVSFSFDLGTTESYFYDFDSKYFYVSNVRYDGTYSGYFTDNRNPINVSKINIMSINDLHGHIEQTEYGKYGLSNMEYLINQIRNESINNSILIANGDMFQGTALSNLSYGEAVINCLNEMEVDCLGVGNHEFDWGIDKIFKYFDGDNTNGEANFPLINSNIIDKSNKLVGSEYSKVSSSLLLERDNVKIGILSYLDPECYTSILKSRVIDYSFEDIVEYAKNDAKKLKNNGVDIVIVNIHGGNSSGLEYYSANKNLAKLTYGSEYLIDVVINGHTHSQQNGVIERDGVDMSVVQAGSNGYNLGNIELFIDQDTKKITSVNSLVIYSSSDDFDSDVEDIVDSEYAKYQDQIEKVFAVSDEDVDKYDLYDWGGNVMRCATGSDIAISNKGGFRGCNITKNADITFKDLYEINPFDNEIIIVQLTGDQVYEFAKNDSLFYSLSDDISSFSSLNGSNKIYKVAVIDYVYYWSSFPSNQGSNSHLIFRDLMKMDLEIKHENGLKFKPISSSEASINNQIRA